MENAAWHAVCSGFSWKPDIDSKYQTRGGSAMGDPEKMWQCQTNNCGYIYDPDKGDRKGKIAKGIQFEDLPDTWRCPICGGTKKCFRPLAGTGSTAQVKCELPTGG